MQITPNEHLEIIHDIETGNPSKNRTATVIRAKNDRIAFQTHAFLRENPSQFLLVFRQISLSPGC